MKPKYLEIILALILVVVVVSGFATTWMQTTNVSYGSIGMSADGRIVCAAPSTSHASISTNWGLTWAVSSNGPIWNSGYPGGVAASADGSRIYLASMTNGVAILVSTNCGYTWSTLLTTNRAGSGMALACSADGTKVVSGINSLLFSTNRGANWSASTAPTCYWISLSSSADGSLMVGAIHGGEIYFSTNFGATWTPTNLPAQSWGAACVSSDGQWVGATGTNTYISSTAGASWSTNGISGNTIACSAHGTNWIIAGSEVYTSNDGGVTWQTNLPPGPGSWYSSAVSANGCEFMIIGTPGTWAGRNTPSPQLNIQSANGNLALSWLVPSTNFVLQQNSDLATANWATIPNSPTLNFTNLQDEVTLSPPGSDAFFRLIAQ